MDVERLIHDLGALREACAAHQRNAAGAEVCRAAAAALAKLQAERDEAIDAQFTVDENCVSIGWEEVAAMWRSRATHAEARAEKAEAERDEAREALRPFAEANCRIVGISSSADDPLVGYAAWTEKALSLAHFRAASRALGGAARSAPNATTTGDGGWLFVKSLFSPRAVARLSVPGAGPDGMHRIEVELSDGSSVMVTGVNHQAAWQSLADAAAAGRALGGGE